MIYNSSYAHITVILFTAVTVMHNIQLLYAYKILRDIVFFGLCGQWITHEIFISLVKLWLAQGLH